MQKNKDGKLKNKISDSRFYVLDSKFCSRGFTIVELLVSIGLFSVIVSVAMGGFVRALRTQRQIVALITANSNVSLVVEQMSREMRTGFNFGPAPSSCPLPADPESIGFSNPESISFTNSAGRAVVYSLVQVTDANGTYGTISRQVNANGALGSNPITAENVNIRNLKFYLSCEANYPPRITMLVGLSPRSNQAASVSDNITNIQTTISARGFGQ